jgi:predicted PurR-regulated permease PerM
LITQVTQFVIYLIVSGLLVGFVTFLVFWWLGVAYPTLWGVAAGVLNAIPYLGPAVILIGSTGAALVQFQSWGMAVAVGSASLAITSFEGMVLSTILFGRLARMHPVAVFLSIMFWSWLWGPIGTFLAVPLTTAAKYVVDQLPGEGRTAALLADDGLAPANHVMPRSSTGRSA